MFSARLLRYCQIWQSQSIIIVYEWIVDIGVGMFTLAPGEECEGHAFGSVCLYVCLSVRMRIDLIFLHNKYYARGSVLL